MQEKAQHNGVYSVSIAGDESLMSLFGQNNPYMTRPHGLGNPNANYTRNASYQIVPGPSGLPMAQGGGAVPPRPRRLSPTPRCP